MPFTQQNRTLAISTDAGRDVLLLEGLTGWEYVSSPFVFQVELLTEKPALDVSSLLGKPAAVSIKTKQHTRAIHGLLTQFVAGPRAKPGTEGLRLFRAELRPALWTGTLARDSRIFQDKTVPEIVQSVLGELRQTVRTALTKAYPRRDFCVQYDETHFAFVSRLLEDEGIYYYFEHTQGQHTMVLADDSTRAPATPGLSQLEFDPNANATHREKACAWELEVSDHLRPGKFALADYDFLKPKTRLLSTTETALGASHLEVFGYPGGFMERPRGDDLVKVAARADQRLRKRFSLTSNAPLLVPGCKLSVTGANDNRFPGDYLVTQVEHWVTEPYDQASPAGPYQNIASMEAADVRYTPPRSTPKPIVRGPQTAVVVGASGREIHVDEHARIHVRFHWDRRGLTDQRCSCPVRVAQTWAGGRWGALFIPRIGQEVIVEFLDGDPDRPIVTGAVYNGENRTPYELPRQASRSTVKSSSTTGGKGFNELRFEDKAGEEQVFLHAQKDMDTAIEEVSRTRIGQDRHTTIVKDDVASIGGDQHVTIGAGQISEVGSSASVKTGTSLAAQAGTEIVLKAGTTVLIEGGIDLTIKAGDAFVRLDPSGVTIQGPLVRINSGGSPSNASVPDGAARKPEKTKET